jgi:hypothetical protein
MIGEGLRTRQSMEVFEKPMHARIGGNIDEADLLTRRLTFAAQVFGYFVGKAEFSARQKKQPPLRRLPQGAISRRSVFAGAVRQHVGDVARFFCRDLRDFV